MTGCTRQFWRLWRYFGIRQLRARDAGRAGGQRVGEWVGQGRRTGAAAEQAVVRVVDVELERAQRVGAEDAVDLGLIGAQLGAQRLERRVVVGYDEHLHAARGRSDARRRVAGAGRNRSSAHRTATARAPRARCRSCPTGTGTCRPDRCRGYRCAWSAGGWRRPGGTARADRSSSRRRSRARAA